MTSVSEWRRKRGFTLHPCSLGSEPAGPRHTPHSWLSDTSVEVINTKETHRSSNIRGTKKNYTTTSTKRTKGPEQREELTDGEEREVGDEEAEEKL